MHIVVCATPQAASEAKKRELSISASRLEAQVRKGVGSVAWGRSTVPVPRIWAHVVPSSKKLRPSCTDSHVSALLFGLPKIRLPSTLGQDDVYKA